MSSSSNGNNNNVVHPLSFYLSSLSGHQDINPYNQLTASPGQMVSAVPDSFVHHMARFNSNHAVNQQDFEFPEVSREIKKVVKKDRHSKIHTAQGLRDRRVRLSIGIARQFFDLQDILGYDKASKTLDWLLKKSRKAIKEVEQAKRLNNDDEEIGINGESLEDDDEYDDGNKSFVYDCEEEEVKKAEKIKKKSELSKISSKGSRAKAKGKEKEKEKTSETVSEITESEIMDPFKSPIIFNEGEDITHSFYKEAMDQESILTKSKINLPTNLGYNQHNGTFMMTDQSSSSSYNTILSQILDHNYDQNPFVEQSFSSVTDTNFLRGFP